MTDLPDFDDYDNPPANEREKRRGHMRVTHSVPAGVVRPLERLARIETTLEALVHILETVAEDLEVLRDTVREALGRVRRDLGQAPTDDEPDVLDLNRLLPTRKPA
jgi:hypothetical protein